MEGLRVMIGFLGGNKESVESIKESLGKEIKTVQLVEDDLIFNFSDGTNLRIFDDGQSCCEIRYMKTDDDLTEFSGATLLDFELSDAPSQEDEYGEVHEIQFLNVKTSNGVFQMASHNEHNGYYGGFWIIARRF